MDTDIALARLASGRAVPIGAECGCGVHGGPPGFVWKQAKRSMLGPPFSLQVSFTTVKCRATAFTISSDNHLLFHYLSLSELSVVASELSVTRSCGGWPHRER